MSQADVETVREFMSLVDDIRNGDLSQMEDQVARARDLMTDDVEIDMSARVFNPAVYRGLDDVFRLLREIREVWEVWHVVPEQFLDAGDRVVTIEALRARGRGSGLEVEGHSASVWTLRDGQVTRIRIGLEIEEALKAVGMEA